MPTAGGPYVPDAFTNTQDGRGITWGLCHNTNARAPDGRGRCSVLMRFDCDLSQDIHDPQMKRHANYFGPDVYYQLGLSRTQRERIARQNPEGRQP